MAQHIDCIIEDWQIVTFVGTNMLYKVVRGIIIEDFNRPFEPGYWVCSTPIVYEDKEEGIAQTNNTIYKLVGDGEEHETKNFKIYTHMMGGLDFQQASWIEDNEQKLVDAFRDKHDHDE